MYRGIIQHKTYLTPYLKSEIKERALSTPLNCGRIYRIVPKGKTLNKTVITNDTATLLNLLQSSNAWTRNQAQQLLIDGKQKNTAPALKNFLTDTDKPLTVIHAMWTLEGLGLLAPADVLPLLQQGGWPIRMQALTVLPSVLKQNNYRQFLPVLEAMIDNNDTLAAPYIGFLLNKFQLINQRAADNLLLALTKKYGANIYVADAIISNLQNKENAFYKQALKINPDTSIAINKRLIKLIADIQAAKNTSNADKIKREYPRGAALFKSVCQTCHGADGNGVISLAPPLNKSEWVAGEKNRLISIVLYGLTGPVSVNGKLYKAPEINGDMPGIFENKEMSDDDIADLLNFIRNSWNNKASKISANDIITIRDKNTGRQNAYTADELKKLK
jgi:mono/diheme cytochrome c family protein